MLHFSRQWTVRAEAKCYEIEVLCQARLIQKVYVVVDGTMELITT